MMNNRNVDEFNSLVVQCAGPERKDQETYLIRVIMKVMIEFFERDTRLPDANVLHALIAKGIVNEICEANVFAAMKVLDTFYKTIACALLDDPDFDPSNIRSEVITVMQKGMSNRRAIQSKASV